MSIDRLYSQPDPNVFFKSVEALASTPLDRLIIDKRGLLREKNFVENLEHFNCCNGRREEQTTEETQKLALGILKCLTSLKRARAALQKEAITKPELLEFAPLAANGLSTMHFERTFWIPYPETTDAGVLIEGKEVTRQQVINRIVKTLQEKKQVRELSGTEGDIFIELQRMKAKTD